jgi:hypothetical protein
MFGGVETLQTDYSREHFMVSAGEFRRQFGLVQWRWRVNYRRFNREYGSGGWGGGCT